VTLLTPTLSIVMPAGPGDDAWHMSLPALQRACTAAALDTDVVLVLPEAVSVSGNLPLGVRVLHAPTGRASQLNAGAQASDGDWLWFVHADSAFDADALDALQRVLARNEDAIGYFDLRFLGDGPALTVLNAAGAWLRSRLLGLPFGDQALLMPRRVYDRLGGFADVPGEDHALVWAARRAGVPLRPVGATVHTSARRYAMRGWLATTLRHLVLTAVQAWRYSRGAAA